MAANGDDCSLPHRQLRKLTHFQFYCPLCSLPHRQLRKLRLDG
ncbi:conserved protein of unknown function [Shewanella benthica]|uniref:Uncharacterized protein n=1 Tax=Shewanella benthica TaxID=43661 RepID=A0A330M9J7_9GAMM|nr:conserved protein of unknown function [Shewanella benthica]